MKPFRGVFSARPYGSEPNGNGELRLAGPAPVAEVAPGLVSPRPGPKHLLWEVLVELGFVDEHRVLEAEAVARASRQDLAAVLLERGLVSSEQLARAVAQREGVLFADLETYAVDERAASLITPAVAERYGAIPIGFGPGGEVLLALANPRERHAVNDISMMVDPSVTRVVATQESIDALIRARKEDTYEGEAGEGLADRASEPGLPETTTADDGGLWYSPVEAAETGSVEDEVVDAPAQNGHALEPLASNGLEPDALAQDGSAPGAPAAPQSQPAEPDESPQWFDSDAPSAPPLGEESGGPSVAEPDSEPDVSEEPASEAADSEPSNASLEPHAIGETSPDRELLESLTRSVEQLDRLARELRVAVTPISKARRRSPSAA